MTDFIAKAPPEPGTADEVIAAEIFAFACLKLRLTSMHWDEMTEPDKWGYIDAIHDPKRSVDDPKLRAVAEALRDLIPNG